MKYELKKPKEPAVVMAWSQQSPIDLGKSLYTPHLPALEFSYEGITLTGQFKDDNFVVDVADSWKCHPTNVALERATICYDGIECPLVKVHFHTPSEHSVDFVRTCLEVHLVHKVPTFPESFPSAYIVVGVLYHYAPTQKKGKKKSGKQRSLEDFVLREFLTEEEGTLRIKPRVFLPVQDPVNDTGYPFYRYEGSLTTSPYSENVSWIVLKDHNELDTHDEIEVEKGAHESARDLQPVNRRFVLRNFP